MTQHRKGLQCVIEQKKLKEGHLKMECFHMKWALVTFSISFLKSK